MKVPEGLKPYIKSQAWYWSLWLVLTVVFLFFPPAWYYQLGLYLVAAVLAAFWSRWFTEWRARRKFRQEIVEILKKPTL